MRLIDADEMAVNESDAYMNAQTNIDNGITFIINSCVHAKVQRLIADTPTVDAVPVVRCKDCIHAVEIDKDYIRKLFVDGTKQCAEGRGDMCYGASIISPDGFCDSGERRADEWHEEKR